MPIIILMYCPVNLIRLKASGNRDPASHPGHNPSYIVRRNLYILEPAPTSVRRVIHLFKENLLDTGDNAYGNPETTKRITQLGLRFPELSEETFKRMIVYFQRQKEIV